MSRRLLFFTTDQRDGHARTSAALKRILSTRGIRTVPACGEQVHDAKVRVVPKLRRASTFLGVDGLLTAAVNQPLAIFTADCVPIFLSAPQGQVVGVLHAGWRGVKKQILGVSLKTLRSRWGVLAKDVRVVIGPSIRPCCFEVKWDVARFFPLTRRRKGDRWTVDLAGEVRAQARRAGLKASNIRQNARCTAHDLKYYSYRRDNTDKRQVSVIVAMEKGSYV